MLNGFCGAGFFALLEKMERHKQKEKGEEAFLDLVRYVAKLSKFHKTGHQCFRFQYFGKKIINREEKTEPNGNDR